jgi:hypothetical protein
MFWSLNTLFYKQLQTFVHNSFTIPGYISLRCVNMLVTYWHYQKCHKYYIVSVRNFSLEAWNGQPHLHCLWVDAGTILKSILQITREVVHWIHLAQHRRLYWRFLLNTIMKHNPEWNVHSALTSSLIFCNLTIFFVNQDNIASVRRMVVNNGQKKGVDRSGNNLVWSIIP